LGGCRISTKPWIGAADTSGSWFGFPHERTLISKWIASHNITNLVVISGDAHMVAIDDGKISILIIVQEIIKSFEDLLLVL
jgi:phosphodiesterase/alkaline phosphatase D-like protein